MKGFIACIIVFLSSISTIRAWQVNPNPEGLLLFEKKVRPILVNHCYACHSAETKPAGGLRVDDRNGLLRGGEHGPAAVPGRPEESLLLKRVTHPEAKRRMPKEGEPLTESQIADLTAWIKTGLAWPQEAVPGNLGKKGATYDRLKTRHWAWQPLTNPAVPQVNSSWPWSEIDRFVLAKLQERGLSPVGDAGRGVLIRRLTFDLTGLPPTPAEVDRFLADGAPGAYERLVDRLLASPRFGERFGRHWLDIARYGESSGPSRNIPYPHAWRYRDYVIDAFNRDVPYNRFLEEQLAGDLLPAATAAERDRLLIATGFLSLGPKDVNQRFKERFVMDNVAEQIDTVTRSTMALTVGCARCHDHKFDPIPVTDYYALAGIFASTDDCAGVRSKMGGAGWDYYDPSMLVHLTSDAGGPPREAVAELEARVAAAKKEWDEIRDSPDGLALGPDGKPKQRPYRLKYESAKTELLLLTDPASRGMAVHGARESKTIADTQIRIRGEAERLGPTVPRGFLTAITVPGAAPVDAAQSGRLQLAQWIASPKNPLTGRVIVNRIWGYLFGEGLVKTPDNFGVMGDKPSHPELLDYLASRFINSGWSVKALVRELVVTHAYRLGGETTDRHREIDPANRLIWHHAPRRLDAEEFRDTVLAASGQLKLEPPAGSPAMKLRMIEMPDNGLESRAINEAADYSVARSVYLPLLRGVTPKALDAFDPVTQTLVTGQRDSTTVPTQALFLLNSSFVKRQALSLAEALLAEPGLKEAARIERAYRLTLNRAPSSAETERARRFLRDYQAAYAKTPPVRIEPVVETARLKTTDGKPPEPADPDSIDRTDQIAVEAAVVAENPKTAAWMSLAQALYASAEFRFVR